MKKVLIIDQDHTLKKLFEIVLPGVSFTLATDDSELKSNLGPFDLILVHPGLAHPSFKQIEVLVCDIATLFPFVAVVVLAWKPLIGDVPPKAKVFHPPFKIFQVISFVETALNIKSRFLDRHPGWS